MMVRDTDANLNTECNSHVYTSSCAELQINFEQLGYSINEGDSVAGQIAMQFGGTEDDFTLKLTPVSIADSKSMYDVVAFIDPDTTDEEARASTGERR